MENNEETKKCYKCKEEVKKSATKCKYCGTDLRNWFLKHRIISVFLILIILGLIIQGFEDGYNNTIKNNNLSSETINLDRVIGASEAQVLRIKNGLEKGLTIGDMYSIKSKDYENVYFVGGLVNGPGIDNQIMIWATGGYDYVSLTLSAESVSAEFSEWPLGRETKVGVDANNDEGADILKKHLKNIKQ